PPSAVDSAHIDPRDVTEAAKTETLEHQFEIVTPLVDAEVEQIQRHPVEKFAFSPRPNYACAAASRRQVRNFLARRDPCRGFESDAARAPHEFRRDRIFHFVGACVRVHRMTVKAFRTSQIDPYASGRT